MKKTFAIIATLAVLAVVSLWPRANAQLLPINTGTVAGDGTGDSLRTTGFKLNTNFAAIFGAAQPYAVLLGDSRSLINDDSGWVSFTRSNLTWGNRLPIISTSISGKTLQSYIDNWATEIVPLISPISNQTYLISWVGVNDIATNTAQTNLLTLWSNARAAGARVIQFSGGLQQSNAAMNAFIRTNSALYWKFVEITNYASADGIHPTAAGYSTVADAFVSALSNSVPDVRKTIRGVGQSQFSSGTTNNDTAIRSHGPIVIDHDPVWNPFPTVNDKKIKWHHKGSDNHIWIMVSNETANASEDLVFGTFNTARMALEEEGPLGIFAGEKLYASGNARSTDSEYLRMVYNAPVYEFKSLQAGAGSFRGLKLWGASDYIYIAPFPSTGIGISTSAPAATFHVSGSGIFQGALDAGVLRVFVTGSAAVTDQEFLRTATLGSNFIEIKAIGAGAGLNRDIAISAGASAQIAISGRTGGVGINTTNPAANFALDVNGEAKANGVTATNVTGTNAVLGTATVGGQPVVTRAVTNYAQASLTVNASTDVFADITNAVAGNINVTLSTPVVGKSGTLQLLSDGSARTISILCAGVTRVPMSTNFMANATNIVTTASKRTLICYTVRGDSANTNLLYWAQNQP